MSTTRTALRARPPFHAEALLDFLAAHVVDGLETVEGTTYARVLDLPGGPGVVAASLHPGGADCRLELTDPDDESVAVAQVRHLLDLEADPEEIDTALAADPVLEPLVRESPGLRVPGSTDGHETAVRTVVGQQVSVAGAQTVTARIVRAHGEPVVLDLAREHGLDRTFPTPEALAAADPTTYAMPRARAETIRRLSAAVASGAVDLSPGADRVATRAALVELRGIGPWTADYVLMRALADPDVLLATDLVLRRELTARDRTPTDTAHWRPWRSYAGMHLWRAGAPALTSTALTSTALTSSTTPTGPGERNER
ncbi:DNA-3-methyladenine glycosylase family protein [Aeromicrobium sp. CF4.19]|uniref:DNA-3-methyladenine glycosylase family protein n=1 Tax=Aeromicrobium sp. CF4.19 TaxID=3373082 RepID=UPI003EE686AA